jgi:hypothetical protein
MLVNGIAQIAPLDVGSKQALLEAPTSPSAATCSSSSCSSSGWLPGGADGPETLQ